MDQQIDPQELAELCAQAMYAGDRVAQDLGMQVVSVGPGVSRMSMTVRETMANGHGIGHGGYVFMLADAAFAFACNTYNQRTVAQQCVITFIKPVAVGDVLTAEATEIHREGRSGIYDIRVIRQDGTMIASFRGNSRTIAGTWIGADAVE